MSEARVIRWTPNQEKLRQWARDGHLFAFVDPSFELPLKVPTAKLEMRDTDPIFFEVIAWERVLYKPPMLVQLTPEALEWVFNCLSTERWGLYVVSQQPLEVLAQHFQKFVIARGPDSNPYFLRFQDAAVLDVLIRTWDPKERSVFFGPCALFGLPDLETLDVKLEGNTVFTQTIGLPVPEDYLLQLKDHQLRLCAEAIDRDLITVIYWHLRNHHSKPVQFIDKSVLEKRIHFAIRKARGYSLVTVADLAGFTALMFELAPNFDDHPSFRSVLMDTAIPAENKMRKLSQVITNREWQEAAGLYDRKYWSNVLGARTRASGEKI